MQRMRVRQDSDTMRCSVRSVDRHFQLASGSVLQQEFGLGIHVCIPGKTTLRGHG